MPGPRNGPCSPWCGQEDIEGLPRVKAAAANLEKQTAIEPGALERICAESAQAASEVLYELSGRVFTGQCGPMTVRPVSRPSDIDTRSWGARLSPLGWFSSWGLASSYGSSMPGVLAHYGSSEPPTIKLPYPVTKVTQVKIDGVIIPGPYDPNLNPTGEWELRDFQELVRIRPTASFAPTQRYGWPTTQLNDLPDTQQGTFSVTFMYGTPPPVSGKVAAIKLAEFLALPRLGDTSSYPRRVKQVSRQGVTASVADVTDMLRGGMVGIVEIDLFLNSVNPHRLARQSAVWSPDIGRPRRQATPQG